MLGLAAVPGTIMFVGSLHYLNLPVGGDSVNAESILQEIRDTDDDVHEEVLEIQEKSRNAIRIMLSLSMVSDMMKDCATRNLLVGCSLMALQQ